MKTITVTLTVPETATENDVLAAIADGAAASLNEDVGIESEEEVLLRAIADGTAPENETEMMFHYPGHFAVLGTSSPASSFNVPADHVREIHETLDQWGKIAAVKRARFLTGRDLYEAKWVVENLPDSPRG